MAESTAEKQTTTSKQSTWRVIISTCAAAFGVQTDKNRKQDFAQGNIKTYIIAGIVFTLVFIAVIVFIVQLVLSNAGL